MNVNTTKQICWYCEGSVSAEALQCCFCGSELNKENNNSPLTETVASNSSPTSSIESDIETPLDESLARLYKPPYLIRDRFASPSPIEKIDNTTHSTTVAPDKIEEEEIFDVTSASDEIGNSDALSLLLLSLGVFLLTLGFLLFFFAEEGSVTLQWNTNYWFLYCFLALPALYFGFRYLGKIETK